MKNLVLIFALLFGITTYSNSQNPTTFNDWSYEHKVAFKEKATNVINRVFPKIQTKEGWKFDNFNGGSAEISDYTFVSMVSSEFSFDITGKWNFTRKSWLDSGQRSGTFTAKGRVTQSGTVYMSEVCWKAGFEEGKCHTTTDWAYENMFN